MADVGLVVPYDGLLVMLWRLQPFSRVHKALVLALTEKREALQVVGRSLVNCSISNCLQATASGEYIVGKLAGSELVGRPAEESDVKAYAPEVLDGETQYEVLGYCDLEVLSLLHGQPLPQSLPSENLWSSQFAGVEVEVVDLK